MHGAKSFSIWKAFDVSINWNEQCKVFTSSVRIPLKFRPTTFSDETKKARNRYDILLDLKDSKSIPTWAVTTKNQWFALDSRKMNALSRRLSGENGSEGSMRFQFARQAEPWHMTGGIPSRFDTAIRGVHRFRGSMRGACKMSLWYKQYAGCPTRKLISDSKMKENHLEEQMPWVVIRAHSMTEQESSRTYPRLFCRTYLSWCLPGRWIQHGIQICCGSVWTQVRTGDSAPTQAELQNRINPHSCSSVEVVSSLNSW